MHEMLRSIWWWRLSLLPCDVLRTLKQRFCIDSTTLTGVNDSIIIITEKEANTTYRLTWQSATCEPWTECSSMYHWHQESLVKHSEPEGLMTNDCHHVCRNITWCHVSFKTVHPWLVVITQPLQVRHLSSLYPSAVYKNVTLKSFWMCLCSVGRCWLVSGSHVCVNIMEKRWRKGSTGSVTNGLHSSCFELVRVWYIKSKPEMLE